MCSNVNFQPMGLLNLKYAFFIFECETWENETHIQIFLINKSYLTQHK